MDVAQFARLSRLCVLCGDLGLRDGIAALGGDGWGDRAVPDPPELPCDQASAPALGPEFAQRARDWLLAWRETIDVVGKSARQYVRPAWSGDDERDMAEATRALEALSAGSLGFVEGSETVRAARLTAEARRKAFEAAESTQRGAAAEHETRARKAHERLEAFRGEGPGVMLRQDLASEEVRAAHRRVDEARKMLRELRSQLEQLDRERPGLLARKRHQQQHDELAERCRVAEAVEADCGRKLDAVCAAAHGARLVELETTTAQALARLRESREERAGLAQLRIALDEAERTVRREEDAAAARFAALARDEAGLRDRVASLTRTKSNHEQACENLERATAALKDHLGAAFAGLVCAGTAPVLAAEKQDAVTPALADRVARSGLAELLADPELADLREVWLRRIPTTLSRVVIALSTVNDVARRAHQGGSSNDDASHRVASSLIALARTPGFVPRAAASAKFFLALKSLYGLEMVRSRDFGWFTVAVAALVCGRAWARDHQPSLFARLEAEIEHLFGAVMSGVPTTDPRARQILRDATELAEACMEGRRGL